MNHPARLFHFSENPEIEMFEPRPARNLVGRSENEQLVWAIDEWHSPMYFFPRECPRLLLWPLPESTAVDIREWMGDDPPRKVAHIESDWLDRFENCKLFKYEFDASDFESLDDAGMFVSPNSIMPVRVTEVGDLKAQMKSNNVELRVMDSLQLVAHALTSTLHFSAIRMRNAKEWTPPI